MKIGYCEACRKFRRQVSAVPHGEQTLFLCGDHQIMHEEIRQMRGPGEPFPALIQARHADGQPTSLFNQLVQAIEEKRQIRKNRSRADGITEGPP